MGADLGAVKVKELGMAGLGCSGGGTMLGWA
jgi:hypothetical protein